MKHLKRFNTTSEYQSYANSNNFILLNVSSIKVATDKKVIYKKDKYLTFTAEQANSTIQFSRNNSNNLDINLKYSIDNGITWNDYTINEIITLYNIGDSVKFRANNLSFSNSLKSYYYFIMNGIIKASGDITSLLNNIGGNVPLNDYCFYSLFQGCTSLIQAPNLPSKTLADYCYSHLFDGCTSLTTAPKLPATTLADCCYKFMFFECTSLTTAPKLPATNLAIECYTNMFDGCTSLISAPELRATTLASSCYLRMFNRCASLTKAPELPATNLAYGCYWRMFGGCTSLTQAPELPATILAEFCYKEMFSGCTSLIQAPELLATELVSECYGLMFEDCTHLNYIKAMFITTPSNTYTENWVMGVSSTGTFVKNSIALWNAIGNNSIPSRWTIQTANV